MSNSDDEDAYLYSSEDEQPATKRAKTEPSNELGADSGASSEKDARDTSEGTAAGNAGTGASADTFGGYSSGEDEDEEEEEESSDDEIEFLIGDAGPKTVVSTNPAPPNEALAELNDEDDDLDEKSTDITKKKHMEVSKDDGGSSVDINAVAEYEGKPLTQLDLDEIKEKPWRAPGADISDFFNYGFDEFTWTAYCHKQDKLRGDFNPQKVMAKMMGGASGGKGQMPFPFPFMPNMGMPSNIPSMASVPIPPMPNMPMPPNMPVLPNMPIPPNMGMPPNMPVMPGMPAISGMPGGSSTPGFGSNNSQGSSNNSGSQQRSGQRPQNFNRYKKQ